MLARAWLRTKCGWNLSLPTPFSLRVIIGGGWTSLLGQVETWEEPHYIKGKLRCSVIVHRLSSFSLISVLLARLHCIGRTNLVLARQVSLIKIINFCSLVTPTMEIHQANNFDFVKFWIVKLQSTSVGGLWQDSFLNANHISYLCFISMKGLQWSFRKSKVN